MVLFSFHRCFQNADGDLLIGQLVVLFIAIFFPIIIFYLSGLIVYIDAFKSDFVVMSFN